MHYGLIGSSSQNSKGAYPHFEHKEFELRSGEPGPGSDATYGHNKGGEDAIDAEGTRKAVRSKGEAQNKERVSTFKAGDYD